MKGFCEKCRDYVPIEIKMAKATKTIRGVDIEYSKKIAYCEHCNEEVFLADLRDENLKSLEREYRQKAKIVSVADIKKILKDFNIGKRPLSKLLGWGDITLSRYLDGDIPSRAYSDTLNRLKDDPSIMLEFLKTNKDSIKEVAYNKCLAATMKQIEYKKKSISKDDDKINIITKYILMKSKDITPLALQKLLYYAQSFYVAFYNTFLFNNDCEAWIHGPVYSDVYHKYKDYGCSFIEYKEDLSNMNLSTDEIKIIEVIVNSFGCYSGKVLEAMTHSERPWQITRFGLKEDEPSNKVIEKSLIKEYYNKIFIKYNMINVTDIKDYSDDLFKKVC
jgi:putative zinc finger/helix-turn-helix YgiT family protein